MTDQAAEAVSDQVTSRLDMGKEYLVETMTGVAQALRQTGQHLREEGSQPTLAQYADRGAEQIERVSGHMRQRDASDLIAEVEGFARRQPMVFAGGAFALGMLAVRFLRSSGQSPRQTSPSYGATSHGSPSRGGSTTTQGATGGATPSSSSVSHGYAGTGTAAPSTPGTAPMSRPASQPTSTTPGTPQRSTSGPSITTNPRVTPGTPSVGGSTANQGTATPGPGAGAQPTGQPGSASPNPGRTDIGSRSQP